MIRPTLIKRVVRMIAATSVVVVLVWLCLLPLLSSARDLWYCYRYGRPLGALAAHRESIEIYVANIYAGKIPLRQDGRRGYCVLNVLDPFEALYVWKEGDCVVIVFWHGGLMFDQEFPILIYSPDGFNGLPAEFKHAEQDAEKPSMRRVFDFTPIDDHWFYCRWYF